MKAKTRRKRVTTAREFGEAMRAIGAALTPEGFDVLVSMAWCLVPFDQRAAPMLAPAQPYRPVYLEMPRPDQRRVPPRSSSRKSS